MNKVNWQGESVKEIQDLFYYIARSSRFGFFDTIDILLLNVRKDSSITMLTALLRITHMMHCDGKIIQWRAARDRIQKEIKTREDYDGRELDGLMDL